jgi:hypothetical protein
MTTDRQNIMADLSRQWLFVFMSILLHLANNPEFLCMVDTPEALKLANPPGRGLYKEGLSRVKKPINHISMARIRASIRIGVRKRDAFIYLL